MPAARSLFADVASLGWSRPSVSSRTIRHRGGDGVDHGDVVCAHRGAAVTRATNTSWCWSGGRADEGRPPDHGVHQHVRDRRAPVTDHLGRGSTFTRPPASANPLVGPDHCALTKTPVYQTARSVIHPRVPTTPRKIAPHRGRAPRLAMMASRLGRAVPSMLDLPKHLQSPQPLHHDDQAWQSPSTSSPGGELTPTGALHGLEGSGALMPSTSPSASSCIYKCCAAVEASARPRVGRRPRGLLAGPMA